MGKKNNSYTASYKLKVISFAEQFRNRAAHTRREFGIRESNVRYWRKQKELLKNAKSDSRAFRDPKAG
jgi:transposase-like protein